MDRGRREPLVAARSAPWRNLTGSQELICVVTSDEKVVSRV
jgi:hypothetical protein